MKVSHMRILKSHLHGVKERKTMILNSLSILEDLDKSNVMSEILEYIDPETVNLVTCLPKYRLVCLYSIQHLSKRNIL